MDTMSGNKERLFANIEGRVQGVGFRFFTRQAAQELGVTGWVRNDPDGSVTVVAEGDREQLEQLVEALREGPRAAVVDQVDVEWDDPEDEFKDFSVRR